MASVLLVTLAPVPALAEEDKRFFFEILENAAKKPEASVDGSLTSTTFFYQEKGVQGAPLADGTSGPRSASPVGRLFSDLRGQLTAKHVSGGKFDVRADLRGRYSQTQTNPNGQGDVLPTQSGTFAGEELELRELYLKRIGKEYDVLVGRQYSLELAATKFDGVQVRRRASPSWIYLGFAGLYPTRGSRDLRDDYPTSLSDPTDPDSGQKRIMPVAGGLGGAYRFERYYGAIGAVGIMPLFRDQSGKIETPRVFATANGYWRKSDKIDVFHYLVADAMGAAGAGLTNLTVGLGLQPRQTVRLNAQVTRVDTETLNVQAQTRLEEPDANDVGVVHNNIEVARISQESARLGLSVALKQSRFEVSSTGTLRRRPEIVVATVDGGGTVAFPAAQAADIMLSLVDRRSWKRLRLGLSVVRSFGVGGANLNRSRSTVARLDASRAINGGKAEVEGNLSYVAAADDNAGTVCAVNQIETCYGASKVSSVNLGGVGYYHFKLNWFAVGSVNLGRMSMAAADAVGALVDQPAVTTANLFLRIAYRF